MRIDTFFIFIFFRLDGRYCCDRTISRELKLPNKALEFCFLAAPIIIGGFLVEVVTYGEDDIRWNCGCWINREFIFGFHQGVSNKIQLL